MEDCGSVITADDINILVGMGGGTLQYLTLFPRALGTASLSTAGPEDHYITPEALDAILVCRETHTHLNIFLKSEYTASTIVAHAPDLASSKELPDTSSNAPISRSMIGKRSYDRLVALGHVAAFRMYDKQQLLPQSYFEEEY